MPDDSGRFTALSKRLSYRYTGIQPRGKVPPMALRVERIDERLKAIGKKANKASIDAGLGKDYIRNIKRGASQHGRSDAIRKLAAQLECSVPYLLGEEDEPGEPPTILAGERIEASSLPIRYEVGAGYWVTEEDRQEFLGMGTVGPHPRYDGVEQWLERVIGDSMDKEFAPGELVHVVSAIQIGYTPRNGDFVIVVSREHGGHKVERSIKRVSMKGQKIQLWPCSTNPKWDAPLDLSKGGQPEEVLQVEIVGKVVGQYRDRD